MQQDRSNIRFNVLRNALYHTARRRHYEQINRLTSFVVVILGASAMSDIMSRFSLDPIWLGAAIAVFGAIQLVFDFGGKARDHQQLQRDYYHLLADIEAIPDTSEAQIPSCYARMIRITADEPPVLRAIDAKAYNDAADATELPREERLVVPFSHRLLGWALSYDGYEYKKRSELEV